MDLGAFENLISDVMMSSHERSQPAVEIYNEVKQRDPDELALRLANVLQQSTNVEIRYSSAILLEILLEELIEEPLGKNTQNMVKHMLLTCVEIEDDENIRRLLYDMIATAFRVFGGENGWPELFPFIIQCVSGHNDVLPETAMRILGKLFKKSTDEEIETDPDDEVALRLAKVLQQSTNVQIRSWSATLLKMLLEELIEEPLDKYTQRQVKDILLRCIENEDNENVRGSLCGTIAMAFSVFGVGNWWSELFQCVFPRNILLQETANLMEQSTNVEIRSGSAILLRQLIEEPLDVPTKNHLVTLLRCVENENNRTVRKSLCHTIVMAFHVFRGENRWLELFPFINRSVSDRNAFLQESAALIIGSLNFAWIDHSMISLTECFRHLKNADSADVRIAAFGAAISYLQWTDSCMSVDLVPVMMQMLTEGLKRGQEVTTQEALKLLIKWARQVNRLRKCMSFSDIQLVGFVKSAFEIAESQSLEKETRRLAIDFMITLEEGLTIVTEKMKVEFPDASNRLFGILMLMLSAIACHLAENEDDDAGESINYSVVLEFLHRLAVIKDNIAVCFVLREYLAASEWQKRVAAILVVAQIPEVYLKATGQSFDQLVTMVLDLFQDPHPRVRLAAINATSRLSTNLDPDAQFHYHRRVLPALATTIYDFQYPRVQAHAASAMVNIVKKYTPDLMAPYLHETLGTLLQPLYLASDQTKGPTIKLLRQFRQELPYATWALTWPTLHPGHQIIFISDLWEEFK